MPTVSTIKMTARQFLQLGEDPPGVRLELVDGEIAVSPSPVPSHSFVIVQLTKLVGHHIDALKLGRLYLDVDTIFGEYDVRRPDMLFYASDRVHLVGDKAMQGPPDLCVEIISPSSTKVDRRDKFIEYADGGVGHYWIVDPTEKTIEGFELFEGAYRPTAAGRNADIVSLPPFASLQIPLADIWHPS